MASTAPPGCPVHSDFDPLSPRYLQDPFTVLRELPIEEEPIFYAPAIDYYVVTPRAAGAVGRGFVGSSAGRLWRRAALTASPRGSGPGVARPFAVVLGWGELPGLC